MGKKPTKTLPTLEVSADAPNWLKYAREYNEKNPFDLQEYVNKRFKNLKGREKIEVIDQEEFKQKVIRQGLEKRRKDLYKYVRKQLKKNNPRGKKSRGKWLNSFSDKEQQILLSDPKNQPSFWKDSIDGLLFNPSSVVNAIVGKDSRKNSDYYSDYEKSQKESLVDRALKPLGVFDIPAKVVQAPFMDNYTVGDALKGKKNDASLLVDLTTNPLDLLGVGILGKVNKANKVRKATKLPKNKVLSKADDATKNVNEVKPVSKVEKTNDEKYQEILKNATTDPASLMKYKDKKNSEKYIHFEIQTDQYNPNRTRLLTKEEKEIVEKATGKKFIEDSSKYQRLIGTNKNNIKDIPTEPKPNPNYAKFENKPSQSKITKDEPLSYQNEFLKKVEKNKEDLDFLKKWAEYYGYGEDLLSDISRLPKTASSNTNYISSEDLDSLYKKYLTRHNTFVRGVNAGNIEQAKKMVTTIPDMNPSRKSLFGRANVPKSYSVDDDVNKNYDYLYTSNNYSLATTFGLRGGRKPYVGIVRRPLDFSGKNRKSWIEKNDFKVEHFLGQPHDNPGAVSSFIKKNKGYYTNIPNYKKTYQKGYDSPAKTGWEEKHYIIPGLKNKKVLDLVKIENPTKRNFSPHEERQFNKQFSLRSLIPPAIGIGLGMQHYNNKDMKKKPKYLPGKLPTLSLLSNIEMPIGSTQYQKAANSMSYEQPPMGKPSREFFMSGDVGYGISSALLSASVAHAGQAYANKRNMQSYLHSINPHAKYGQTPIMQSSFIEKLLENPEFNAKDKEYLTKHFSKLINNKGVSEGNSEVEGGEIIRNSITGENYKMDGKSHAKGGIQMNVKPEDAIYSQALTGVNGKKISDTAKEHMKIEKDLTKNINSRPNDQRSMNTYKRMMDKLKKEELLNMIIQESHAKKGMYKYGKKPMYYMGKNPNSTQITQEELEEIQANFVNKQPTKNLMGEGGIYNDYLDWSLGPNFEYKPSKQTTNNNFIPFTSGNQLLFGPYPKQAQNSSFGYNFMTELMKANMNNRNTTQTSSTLPFSKTGINANSQTSPIDIQGNTVVEKGFGTKKYRYNPDVVGRNLIATGQLPGGISIHPEPTDIGITSPMSKNRKKLNLFNKPLFGESNLTDSEKIGLVGNVGSAVTPLISALAFNPTPNTNYFNRARGFGQESTRLMRNSGNFIDDQEAKALDDITLASNASRRNIQNRSRSSAVANAFESAAGAREGAAKSDVRNKAALASANIASVLGEKISRDEQLEATGDTQVEIRDQQDYATRANRIAEGVSNLFAGTQAIGQSMSSRVYQMMQTDAYKQLAEQVGNATALQLLLGINLNSSKKEES